MARPRKNVNALQGDYSKEDMQKRIESEKAITGDSDNIIIPKFIEADEIAVNEYVRIVDELKKVGLVTNVDSTMLGIYADRYSKFVESTMCMKNEPLVTECFGKNGEVIQNINQYVKVQQQYATMLMKISTLYGLDPASRSKIAHLKPTDKEEQVDPLMQMLSSLKGGTK